jgi:hypothetical protein
MEEREVVDMARALRPHLDRLLGPAARDVDGELQELLGRSEAGHDVGVDVLRVVSRHEATRVWAQRLLDVPAGERVYEPLPGQVQGVSVPRYVCPRYAECGVDFYRFSVAEHVPSCAVHGLALVEESA